LYRAMDLQMDGRHFDTPPRPLASALGASLSDGAPSPALIRLSLRLGLGPAYTLAASRATDAEIPALERAEFVRALGELRRPESLAPLLRLLGNDEPTSVRAAALQSLQRYDSPEVAAAILAGYPRMPATLRSQSRDVLVSRSNWSASVLSAAETGTIAPGDFSLDQVRRILLHADPSLASRVEKLWGRVRPATTRETEGRIAAILGALAQGQGNASRGKPIADRLCLTCHQLSGDGRRIGPDLTAVDRTNLDVLVRNVVDPSGVIREGYQQYVVTTTDGRVLSGILAETSGGKVTVLDPNGGRTSFSETEVDAMKHADASLMPEGILNSLSDQEVRDLFAYLRSYAPGSLENGKPAGQAVGGAERRARD
jgi:putative heme-binding domain-containing protein